eukprot:CAMPEP_0204616598 /NCGR_PEP_ID=MMETSP0717-20131115/3796_1 /ASSEMBLY_ACC=CAM_ASM_000666 /TAXON_ID=230516 /ORGANISM="Chaetoceros curvisetus" /LENGTH=272 /DNA_ID=CAMNT_0051629881 /DNA_START=231 /DNA_END=1049 /DNA_ORIENTATION=+
MNSNQFHDELSFTTSVDTSIQQNVPVPSQPPTLNGNMDGNNNNAGGEPSTQSTGGVMEYFKNSAHPIPCLFHILFKGAAIFTYFFGGVFKNATNFITVTVICILLLAADFWVVKNITGRLLVGLRWWAQVEGEDGTETRWIFESAEGQTQKVVNKFDQTWFWGVLYATPAIWAWFFFTGLMRMNFGWLITVSFALALNCANVYGYWQCSKDQKSKFQQMFARGAEYGAGAATQAMMNTPSLIGKMSSFASSFTGSSGTGQAQGQGQQGNTFV